MVNAHKTVCNNVKNNDSIKEVAKKMSFLNRHLNSAARVQTSTPVRLKIGFSSDVMPINTQHYHAGCQHGARTSQYCEPDQTLFAWGAYTESDNAPVRKIGSGYATLASPVIAKED